MTVKRIPTMIVAGVAGIAMLGLSGCAGGIQPGEAATIGDVKVSQTEVNDLVRVQCATPQLVGQAVPKSRVATGTLNQLMSVKSAEAYFDRHPVTISQQQLDSYIAEFKQQLDTLPKVSDEDKKTLLDFVTRSGRTSLQKIALGTPILVEQGVAKPGNEQAAAAGDKVVATWAEKQGLDINPRYNPGTANLAGGGSGSISKPASAFSRALAGNSPDAAVAKLPDNLVCGVRPAQ